MNVALWKLLASIQLSSASFSFIACSSATAVMIIRSQTSNGGQSLLRTSPYHRIILGLSVSDMLQSIAFITGPFAAPAPVSQALWAVGNSNTRRMNGFIPVTGSTVAPMYILMLCFYCLYSMKRTRPNQNEFPRRLEWINGVIILFNFCLCVSNTLTKGTVCGFTAYPTGCRQRLDVLGECDDGIARHVFAFLNVSSVGISLACLLGVVLSMGIICLHVFRSNAIFRSTGEGDNGVSISSLRTQNKKSDDCPVAVTSGSQIKLHKLEKDQEMHGPAPVLQLLIQAVKQSEGCLKKERKK